MRRAYSMVRYALVERDVLGLKHGAVEERMRAVEFARAFAPPPRIAGGDRTPPVGASGRAPTKRAFQYSPPADRLAAFNQFTWEVLQEELLGMKPGLPSRGAGEKSWQRRHLDRAVEKGRKDASGRWARVGGRPRKSGDAWTNIIRLSDQRAERLAREARAELVRQQSFTELEGISDAMSARISRIISAGVLSGDSPAEIARELAAGADIDIGRARTIARTETIRAYNEAALQEFEEAGAAGVTVQAEWSTVGDDHVCPFCEEMEGKVMSLEDAHGLIPLHPNCRCAWLPVVGEPEEAPPPPEEEKGGAQLTFHGDPSEAFKDEMLAMWEKAIPEHVKLALREAKVETIVTSRLIDSRPDLTNVRPRGYPEGATWQNSGGLFDGGRLTSITAEMVKDLDTGVWIRNRQASSTIRHETGHAFDASQGRFSRSAEYRAAYDADVAEINRHWDSGYLKQRYKYYLQPGDAGPSEAFAETFATLTGTTRNEMLKFFPRSAQLMKERFGL